MALLTDIQLKTVRFIHRHAQETGIPPSLREITKFFNWKAVGSAQAVIAALRRKGMLAANSPGKARQLRLTPLAHQTIGVVKDSSASTRVAPPKADSGVVWVPLLGQVQAGLPTGTYDPPDRSIPFPVESLRRNQDCFCLTVEGFSMINAGLLPGDVILVERTPEARNGDVVVAMTEPGEVTVKRLALRGSDLYRQVLVNVKPDSSSERPPAYLVPENPVFEPIPFSWDDGSTIVGLVRALFRGSV